MANVNPDPIPLLSDPGPGVQLPPAPGNQPNDTNFSQSMFNVRVGIARGQVDVAALRQAIYTVALYHRMGMEQDGGAPPWAEAINNLSARLARLEVVAAQSHNANVGTWHLVNYLPVPFPDGRLPEDLNLPPLATYANISALTGDQAREYCQNYYPDVLVPHLIIDRKRAIRRAVGCLVMHE